MAARFFISGGVNNNWSSTTNWSTTSGGSGGSAVPTSADDVTLDANSPNCTVDVSSIAKTLTATTYTNTLRLNAQLQIGTAGGGASGANVTFGSAMAFAGSSQLLLDRVTATTITTNGVTVGVPLNIDGTSITLADTLNISALLTLGANFATSVAGVGLSINCSGSFTGGFSGTITALNFTGTGTWSAGSITSVQVNINTSGTITVSSTGTHFLLTGGKLAYLAGTVVATGSTIAFQTSGAHAFTPGSGVTWGNITIDGGTMTLAGDLTLSGTLSLNANFATTVNGFQVNAGSVTIGGGSGTTLLNVVRTGTITENNVHSFNMTINAPGSTVTIASMRRTGGTLTYTAGTLAGRLAVTSSTAPTPYAAPFFGG